MINYEDDPLIKFCKDIQKMANDLNRNIECFKALISIQHTQNAGFIESISHLAERVRILEEKR